MLAHPCALRAPSRRPEAALPTPATSIPAKRTTECLPVFRRCRASLYPLQPYPVVASEKLTTTTTRQEPNDSRYLVQSRASSGWIAARAWIAPCRTPAEAGSQCRRNGPCSHRVHRNIESSRTGSFSPALCSILAKRTRRVARDGAVPPPYDPDVAMPKIRAKALPRSELGRDIVEQLHERVELLGHRDLGRQEPIHISIPHRSICRFHLLLRVRGGEGSGPFRTR